MEDIRMLRAYISRNDPAAAERIAQTIISDVGKLLSENPGLGRSGRVPGTREFVVAKTPFIIPYRVKDRSIHILRVYHAARRWPEKF